MHPAGRLLLFVAVLLILIPLSFAETTCTRNNCDITITVKIAFSGANDSYINGAKNEIENTWNGPNGFRTIGDCKCTMRVKVETKKITNPNEVNCNPGPPGYHCVMVTDYNTNPPRNQSNWTGAAFYAGYMFGIATGNGSNSQTGWWSNMMSRPAPQGGNYLDMAHEAGHMMGLNHTNDSRSIMNNTLAGPTQDDLENAAAAICGPNPCPDSCCCGNGKVEKNKGEGCDPLAMPDGCKSGEACCPVCCNCYVPLCIAANGEYLTQTDCTAGCGAGSACYKNYKTGCWDCVKQTVVVHDTCRDPVNIRGNPACDHPDAWSIGKGNATVPRYAVLIGSIFQDERLNIRTAEGDTGHIVTEKGLISDYGDTLLGDPTGTVYTNRTTISQIAGGRLRPARALSGGMIRIEGNGLVNSIRFWLYTTLLGLFDSGPEESEVPAAQAGPEFPPEYYEAVTVNATEPAAEPRGIGEVPDATVGH